MNHDRRERLIWQAWGKRLREARTRAALSQLALAAAIGVTQPTISKWELGDQCPDEAAKIALAETLDQTLDELFPWPNRLPPREVAA
jgi:transcriptional regulator with XRE-family HTH domain